MARRKQMEWDCTKEMIDRKKINIKDVKKKINMVRTLNDLGMYTIYFIVWLEIMINIKYMRKLTVFYRGVFRILILWVQSVSKIFIFYLQSLHVETR